MEASKRERFETPGTLVILGIYLAMFLVMWFVAFLYLATRWVIS